MLIIITINIPLSINLPFTVFHRQRPILHLSHVGTLDDNFFTGDNDDICLSSAQILKLMLTVRSIVAFKPFALDFGFSDLITNNGIRDLELRGEDSLIGVEKEDDDDDDDKDEKKKEKSDLGNKKQEMVTNVDLQMFIKGLEINHHDTMMFFALLGLLSGLWVGDYGFSCYVFLCIRCCYCFSC
ncbi:unnamed protein product [Vicia faba]|uniref:Uncharacterized protein n=1 Tax=Vicia faba TaxID=3906 RepID=A0AAV1ANX8_VICFA|nr:unnamed protein product [Vicia faba]